MDKQMKCDILSQYFINYINCKFYNQSQFNDYNNLILLTTMDI